MDIRVSTGMRLVDQFCHLSDLLSVGRDVDAAVE